MTTVLTSSVRINFMRHLRSPALWLMGLAAPIAALYMVPPSDAGYATLTVNAQLPILTPAVVGLELGVVTATLLSPLAYIFLRAGATRQKPWQVTDVSPASRPLQAIGQWAADTLTLWIILAALTLAGAVLSYFRLHPGIEWNPFATALTLWLPAAPALAVIAAIRTLFDSRPLLRRWPGDVLFFVFWLFALMVPIAGSAMSDAEFNGSPFLDAFGFTAPIAGSTDTILNSVTIIGSSQSGETIALDAMRGVLAPTYVLSRFFWLAAAVMIAGLAGLLYKPRLAKLPKQRDTATNRAAIQSKARTKKALLVKSLPQPTSPLIATFISELRLILNGRIWLAAIAIAAIIGAIMPYPTVSGPAIWLAMIFPLTTQSSRWQSATVRQLLETTGLGLPLRSGLSMLAGITVLAAAHIPAIIRMTIAGTWSSTPHMTAIILGVPIAATFLGILTKGPVAGRLTLLIAWYVVMSST